MRVLNKAKYTVEFTGEKNQEFWGPYAELIPVDYPQWV